MILKKTLRFGVPLDFFSRRFPLVVLSVITGLLVILVYSILDLLFFADSNRSLPEILFFDLSTHEVFIRTAITVAFLAFGLFVNRVMSRVRQTEQALDVSEKRFETIADYTPSWENWVDSDGKLLWVNPAVERLTGYTVAEAMAMDDFPLPLIHEKDMEMAKRLLREALEGSTGEELEFRTVRKDGSVFWSAISWQPLYDDDGKSLGHRSSIRDISQRKAATEALKQAAEGTAAVAGRDFFRELTRYLANALDVRYVLIGEVMTEKPGFRTVAVWEGEDVGEDFEFELESDACEALASRSADKQAFDLRQHLPEDHLLRRMGVKSCMGAPLSDSQGRSVGVLLMLDDKAMDKDTSTTIRSLLDIFAVRAGTELERQRAEDGLRRSEEKYRVLFERSADALLIIDDNQFVDCNNSTVAMLGYESKEQLLQTHPSALSPAFQPDGRASYEKAEEMMRIATDKGSHRFEWEHMRANGEVFPVEVLLTAVPKGDKQTLHVVWRDITDRKQAEEALKYMIEGTSASVGEDFLRSMVGNLATTLGCKCILVAELVPGQKRLRTLIVWSDGEIVPSFEYDLAGTPCENVLGKETCSYGSNVQKEFPDDTLLSEMGAESYLGTPLFDSSGRPLGLLAVIDDKPMNEAVADIGRTLTEILAARVTAEIERVKAQAALQESEEKFRLISEQSLLGIMMLQDDIVRYLNQAIVGIFEYSVEEMKSWGAGEVLRIVSEEDQPFVADQARRKQAGAGAEEVVTKYPFKAVTKSGGSKWVELYSKTVIFGGRDADLITCVDITERKLAEDTIRKSQQMVQTVLNTIPVRVFWKNRDLEYTGCNRLFAQDAGLQSPDEVVGKTDYDLAWKAFAERYRADDRKVIDAGMLKLGYEEPLETEDGRTTWLRTSKVPFRDQNGNVIGVLGSYEDITERKKAAVALERSEATLSSVLQTAPVGIGLFSDTEGLIWVNERHARITGYTREEVQEIGSAKLFESDEEFRRVSEIRKQDLEKTGVSTVETSWRRKDGRIIDLMINYASIDPDNQGAGFVFTAQDITARKAAENALRRTTMELQVERAALDDKNTALKEVLGHLEKEKANFKQRVWDDVEKELLPFLDSMRQYSPPEQQAQIDVVTGDLKALLSQDVDEFQLRYTRLTPREREICDLIKEGRSSKEISDQLNVSLPTVHKHRERIRRKLKIMNKDVNLNTYLHFR